MNVGIPAVTLATALLLFGFNTIPIYGAPTECQEPALPQTLHSRGAT